MTILSIHHVQLAMPANQEDSARAFYVRILGLTEIPKPVELAKRGGVWFQKDPTAVELPSDPVVQIHLGVETNFRAARKAHPAFLVDDLDALLEKIQATGYECDLSQPPLEGFKRAHVFDPFGNRIELMERVGRD
ncbi:MAG TPA: VOC family protein [Anaerolineales bacterium]|nr:VOC family protein [Anaerolineales bacterium]HMS01208.1 VOC family protein [Anaerolineales bacterium]HNQ94099.1 VOC family protein [Anaerolineales bacterium]HNS61858.1 VOC family protein [Anaerolineales bacterium]